MEPLLRWRAARSASAPLPLALLRLIMLADPLPWTTRLLVATTDTVLLRLLLLLVVRDCVVTLRCSCMICAVAAPRDKPEGTGARTTDMGWLPIMPVPVPLATLLTT